MNRLKKISCTAILMLIVVVLSVPQKIVRPDLNTMTSLAKEAYIFFYPLIENYKTMYMQAIDKKSPTFVPFNKFNHMTNLLDHTFTDVVMPNNDTLYSAAWLDLRAEPMVLTVPSVPKNRYYTFQLVDMFTHNFGYVGVRTTGFKAGNYLIAGPKWKGKKPDGIKKMFKSEGQFVFLLGRTQVNGKEDIPNVVAFQKQYKLQPLSSYMGTKAPTVKAPDLPTYDQKKARSVYFIGCMNMLLNYVYVVPSERKLFKKFAALSIGAGRDFDPDKLDPQVRTAIENGISQALKSIQAKIETVGVERNGWNLGYESFGPRSIMGKRPLTRAAAAQFGLYGNTLQEAFYPFCVKDQKGNKLDASKNKYEIHFSKEEIPPVNAFWSLTVYRLPDQMLVKNPMSRYSIGDRTEGLVYGKDGSLTLYIQHKSPGKEKEFNWLPAPKGPFALVLRLYWPKKIVIDRSWVPPFVYTVF